MAIGWVTICLEADEEGSLPKVQREEEFSLDVPVFGAAAQLYARLGIRVSDPYFSLNQRECCGFTSPTLSGCPRAVLVNKRLSDVALVAIRHFSFYYFSVSLLENQSFFTII